jgi:hypothetical protein
VSLASKIVVPFKVRRIAGVAGSDDVQIEDDDEARTPVTKTIAVLKSNHRSDRMTNFCGRVSIRQ